MRDLDEGYQRALEVTNQMNSEKKRGRQGVALEIRNYHPRRRKTMRDSYKLQTAAMAADEPTTISKTHTHTRIKERAPARPPSLRISLRMKKRKNIFFLFFFFHVRSRFFPRVARPLARVSCRRKGG